MDVSERRWLWLRALAASRWFGIAIGASFFPIAAGAFCIARAWPIVAAALILAALPLVPIGFCVHLRIMADEWDARRERKRAASASRARDAADR
ncbi:hypothetical protein [Lysobacter enzymogenes]|uniref:hypothetical protein n=1 Tax=Lysobacter enzymogenes TaxID=69 RepID=UPI001AF64CB9|nr:hypothetical protein [Lysobacter enzymogenes]QQQ02550.1 hypothetical protein JHW41_06090 [Lysobacter enzymogenes]